MSFNEWNEVLLEEVADEITVGYVGSMTSEYVETGIPFLRSLNVDNFSINQNDMRYISEEFHLKLKKSSLKPGDVVIVRTGKPGTCSVVPEWLSESNCSDLVIVRVGENLNPFFLSAYVNSIAKKHIHAHTVGAVQQHFNVGSAKKMKIKLPSIEEQKSIAKILSDLDKKIEVNNKINKRLEDMAQSIFKHWFVDFEFPNEEGKGYKSSGGEMVESELGMIPKGWEVTELGEIIDIFDSKRIPLSKNKREKMEKKYPYYGAASLMDYVEDYIFDGIYVLMGEDGTVIDENGFPILQYVWGQFWVNNHAHVLKGKGNISEDFIYILLKKQNITASVTGAVQLKINQQNLKSIKLVLPKDNELLDEFSKVIKYGFNKIRNNSDETERLIKLRDALLPKLMSGEIRVPTK